MICPIFLSSVLCESATSLRFSLLVITFIFNVEILSSYFLISNYKKVNKNKPRI